MEKILAAIDAFAGLLAFSLGVIDLLIDFLIEHLFNIILLTRFQHWLFILIGFPIMSPLVSGEVSTQLPSPFFSLPKSQNIYQLTSLKKIYLQFVQILQVKIKSNRHGYGSFSCIDWSHDDRNLFMEYRWVSGTDCRL